MQQGHKDVIEYAEGLIRHLWKERGDIPPLAIMGQFPGANEKGKLGVMPLQFSNDREKDACAAMIRLAAKAANAQFVVFISESWAVEGTSREALGDLSPSEHPDRKEVVLVVLESRIGNYSGRIAIDRSGKKATLGKLEMIEAPLEGRFAGFLGGPMLQ